MSSFINTGIICTISVPDSNRKEGFKFIDLGNFFINNVDGKQCLITTKENAMQYEKYVKVPIYIRKTKESE
jgi:hypothetical protein